MQSINNVKVSRSTRLFILASTFINFAGIGIVNPVLPFITAEYTSPQDSALVIGLLTTVYSLCQFMAVPVLGALSDRYGRRPVLLISFLGSAVGYLIFGIGGALWVFFLGRIIDGLTGGNIAAIQAYVADTTTDQERTRFFGTIGAVGALGFVVGPALGTVVLNLTNSPALLVYMAAGVTLAVTVWGFFVMQESLQPENRAQIRLLLAVSFLWAAAYALLQGNLSYLTDDSLHWTPAQTSLLFFVAGIFLIVSQGVLVKRLLPRLGETRMAVIGLVLTSISYLMIVLVVGGSSDNWMLVAMVIGGLGVGLVNPSLSGLTSKAVGADEQGRVQGGSQALGALARVVGPIWAGWSYQQLGAGMPYLSGILLMGLAVWAVLAAAPVLKAHQARQAARATA